MADELVSKIQEDDSEPIVWEGSKKDDDEQLARKINARIKEAESLWSKKQKQYRNADRYLDGRPDKTDPNKPPMIYNPLFSIIRNMTGLTTDQKPHPSVKLVLPTKNMSKVDVDNLLDLGDKLERSLDDWWETKKMQSWFQRLVFGLYTYSDMYAFPYWNKDENDVDLLAFNPRRVKIDPNSDEVEESYIIIDFYRTKAQLYGQFGEEKVKKANLKFADHVEIRDYEREDTTGEDANTKVMKNVAKMELYMEKEWWVYKAGDKILQKLRCPYWAVDKKTQLKETEEKVTDKYKKKGIAGVAQKITDKVKGAIGMKTTQDTIEERVKSALEAFKPKENYFKNPRIPLIHFDLYRLPGELYSRNLMDLAIPIVDDINTRKNAISCNAAEMGSPEVLIDGSLYNESDAARIKKGRATGEVVRINTAGGKSMEQSVKLLHGDAMPEQYIQDMMHSEKALDTLFGHHEVSRGLADPANRTKGGILALQEADQTPVRYVSRNIEDALQEVFAWVIQIKKIFQAEEVPVGEETIDYGQVTNSLRTFLKSGSMLPVSKEQQRAQAIQLYQISAIDPLTLHERLGEADPEKTAKRLEMWLKTKSVMADNNANDQQQRAVDKLKLIQAGRANEVQIAPDDDPKVHHDIFLLALKSGQLPPQIEPIVAQFIQQFTQLAQQQGSGDTAKPGATNEPAPNGPPAPAPGAASAPPVAAQ